jgi:hypothetical protein
MERIVILASRRQMFRKLAWCISLLGIGGGLLAAGLVPWLGWSLGVLGGGYSLVVLRALGEDNERLVIDDSGIRDSSLPVGTIDWDEVRGGRFRRSATFQ